MTDNLGLGIVLLQVLQEEPQGGLLLGSTGVLGTAFLVQTALIADADGVLVVVADMGAGELLRASFFDGALTVDVPVVAALGEAPGLVPAVDVVDGDSLRESRGGAVYDDVQHVLHGFDVLHFTRIIMLMSHGNHRNHGNATCMTGRRRSREWQ